MKLNYIIYFFGLNIKFRAPRYNEKNSQTKVQKHKQENIIPVRFGRERDSPEKNMCKVIFFARIFYSETSARVY